MYLGIQSIRHRREGVDINPELTKEHTRHILRESFIVGISNPKTIVFFPEGAYGPTNNCVGIGKVLLDREMDHPVVQEIREAVQTTPLTRVTDLHVWRVGKQVFSCAMTVVTQEPDLTPAIVRERLAVHEEVVHSTIEVHGFTHATTNAPAPTVK